MEYVAWLVVAWLVDRSQALIAAGNYGTPYNGVGTVEATMRRETLAPMAYRVLLPMVVYPVWVLARRRRQVEVYEAVKILLMALGLWMTAAGWGLPVALLVAALLGVTWRYDYWDWAVELGALGAAVSGRAELALPMIICHALSRETWPLTAVAFGLVTGDWATAGIIGGAGLLAWGLMRLWVGHKALYCDRVMLRQNWRDLLTIGAAQPVMLGEMVMSLVVSGLVVWAAVLGAPGWPAAVAVVAAGWVLARANETRVFAAALPWAAWAVLSWLR